MSIKGKLPWRRAARSYAVPILVGLLVALCNLSADAEETVAEGSRQLDGSAATRFEKIVLTDKYYCDGIAAGDIDGDGNVDVVAGPFWYAGPTFEQAHAFYEPVPLRPEKSPSDSMFSFVYDFSGDGRPDILRLGRVHLHEAKWYENPGPVEGLWESHVAFPRVRGESPALVDLDGDGVPQVICHWEGRWGSIEPDPRRPTLPWRFEPVGEKRDWDQFYHGEGAGDLNDDGRLDLIVNDGWFEQPPDAAGPWPFHEGRFSQGRGGAQMFAYDVDGDGDQDVISSIDAHGWGLAWYERSDTEGVPSFRERRIMGSREEEDRYGVAFSQPHALALADIDGDGLEDIVAGKRRWAHGPTGDVEPGAAPVLYWFRLTRTPDDQVRYVPCLIDDASGVGVQIAAVDVNADGRPDVLTASKLGAFAFLSVGERAATAAK